MIKLNLAATLISAAAISLATSAAQAQPAAAEEPTTGEYGESGVRDQLLHGHGLTKLDRSSSVGRVYLCYNISFW